MNISKKRTIQDCEEAIENTLAMLRKLGSAEIKTLPGLDIIAPEGFRPIVELYEDDRKKRRTASADNWSPSNGEIRIYFEPANAEEEVAQTIDAETRRMTDQQKLFEQKLPELLNALRDAENTPGRMFVALKWFRDEYLPSTGLSWAQNEEQRRNILSEAIKNGWILTSKVPNPKAPMYPTTTICLNRQRQTEPADTVVSRFRPVPLSGEPLSNTILRDRGSR